MPKKTKTAEDKGQPSAESGAPATAKKKGKRQSRATTAKKPRNANVTKDTTTRSTQISASPQTGPSESVELPEETIRLRAYLISERRRRFALPGDAESDWLEAKRQLLAEARR